MNCRHLGRIRMCLQTIELRRVVLSVIVARCMKQTLDQQMREQMFSMAGLPSDEPFKRLACQFFNTRFDGGDEVASQRYWTIELKNDIQRRFPHALTEEECETTFDLRCAVSTSTVFVMAIELSAIKLAPDIERPLLEIACGVRKNTLTFRDIDIIEIGLSVKKSIVAHVGRALYMLMQGVRCVDAIEARRVLSVARIEATKAWKKSVGDGVEVCI